MTSEMKRTSVYIAFAVVMFGLAIVPLGSETKAVDMGKQGQRFFPEFDDFTQAVALEVVDYGAEGAEQFRVEFKDGLWKIPSRYDYPADAKDKIGKVAASIMTLERTVLRSTKLEDQAKFGVVDPLDKKSTTKAGRGRLITLLDADENALASLIISRPKPKPKDGEEPAKDALGLPEGHRFVRVAGETEIYSAKLDLELSTDFKDWIDTDVLDLAVADISTLTIARYKVDESQLPGISIKEGPTSVLMQDNSEWTVEGQRSDQQASVAAIDSLTEGLRDLKIVDVRPFKGDLRSMVSVGIFPTQERVYGNEGEIRVETKGGLIYVLFFGEEAPGSKGKDPRRFLLIRTAPNPAVTASITDPKKKKELEQKADMLARRFQDWYYVISAKSFKDLRPDPALLVEEKTEEDDHGEDDGHGHGKTKEPVDPFEELGFPPLSPRGLELPGGGGAGTPDGPPGPEQPPEKDPPEKKSPDKTPEDPPKQPDEDTSPDGPKPDKPDAPPPAPPDAKTPEQPKEDKKGGEDGKPGDAPKDGE